MHRLANFFDLSSLKIHDFRSPKPRTKSPPMAVGKVKGADEQIQQTSKL